MTESRPNADRPPPVNWKDRWYEVIFEADTPSGKLFDVVLLIAILLSVLVVMLDSVKSVNQQYGTELQYAEWVFTILFTVEYAARIACSRHPWKYVFSFYGVVDLLAILPTYLVALPIFGTAQAQRLTVIRSLRLMRAFRIFKLGHMLSEAKALRQAVWASRAKISVFISFVLICVVIVGSTMHVVEGRTITVEGKSQPLNPGFDSIPESMYWAIVTMTTVGYGDISPVTPFGKALAACMMILGYCMIIVPTGIVSAELAHGGKPLTTQVCPECLAEGHDLDAKHCKYCGGKL